MMRTLRAIRNLRANSNIATLTATRLACGIAFLVLLAGSVSELQAISHKENLLSPWSGTEKYAVFYPHYNGRDLAEVQAGGDATKITEAKDLYPQLDKAGAIFVDATSAEHGNPHDPNLPAPTITVNENYLKVYPILDEAGRTVAIDPTSMTWVVLVPEQYKKLEPALQQYLQLQRTGSSGFEGAVQAQISIAHEAAPTSFLTQDVKIIWTKQGQSVFSFDSDVAPTQGNVLIDPIVQVMTPANSLPVDRLNSFTGTLNTALKIPIVDTNQTTIDRIRPTLVSLGLDDNLKQLVSANEGALQQLSDVRRSALLWQVSTIVALVAALAFSVALMVASAGQWRRTLVVRQLHGHSLLSSFKEEWIILSAIWALQLVVAVGITALAGLSRSEGSSTPTSLISHVQTPLVSVISAWIVFILIEASCVLVASNAISRRRVLRELKEL